MRSAFSICLLLSFGFASLTLGADKPNVLFLICDDLNCELGSYGHPLVKSPNIDALAARGVRFENCHCQYPLCGPSRASFMTGMYPDQTLVRRNAIYIREHVPNVLTIAQMFRNADYFATRIGKIFHYNVPLHIGTSGHDDPYSWNYTINPRGRDVDDQDLVFTLKPGQYGGTLSWLAADGSDEEQTDGIAATETARQLRKFAGNKTPFFLAVGLYRPHTPYVAPKKYFEMYPVDKIEVPQIPENYLETLPKPAVDSISRRKEQWDLDPKLARETIQAYYASITFADAQVGRILKALDETGLADNTIVVFTSDHGYHMGEHGHYQKTTLFENATRVPLIIAGPGVRATGKTATTLAEMVDIYPTLADLANLTPPKSVAGKSLLPALSDPSAQLRDSAFSQLGSGYSIRTSRYRYTEWGEEASQGAELYDRSTDPEELVNLIDKRGQENTIEKLSTQLRQRITEGQQPPAGVRQIEFDNNRRVPQPSP
ncbi:MAG TPA: sulfatase [Planctomycetaceae bacterium]|nr:sulfatase [Planctomycetaceae bacterium]